MRILPHSILPSAVYSKLLKLARMKGDTKTLPQNPAPPPPPPHFKSETKRDLVDTGIHQGHPASWLGFNDQGLCGEAFTTGAFLGAFILQL